jgi:hypothetical protein|tara:strand:+ start:1049 stop:1273 length:225 start_codon:yes stop_codon:yes gene_type:complete
MQIIVKTLVGKHITIDIENNDITVLEFKHMINKKEPIPFDKVYLSTLTKRLIEDKKLCDYNIGKDSTVEIRIHF